MTTTSPFKSIAGNLEAPLARHERQRRFHLQIGHQRTHLSADLDEVAVVIIVTRPPERAISALVAVPESLDRGWVNARALAEIRQFSRMA
ncbi:hypothetical protein Q3C01_44580, partial [Bradyrhizobium sp. UFLA05-109]